jgi:DNA-binding MarR family transcriptional regulator
MAANTVPMKAARGRRTPERSAELTAALDAIRRIVQALRVSSRTAEQRLGVSGAQLFVLQVLADAPAKSLNDLAARTFTHQSSVSVVVERLVRRRLVSRSRSPQDARRVTLVLTAAGRALLESAPETAQERLVSALRRLSARECRSLTRVLEKLVRAMGATALPPALFFEENGRARERRGAASTSREARSRARRRQRGQRQW